MHMDCEMPEVAEVVFSLLDQDCNLQHGGHTLGSTRDMLVSWRICLTTASYVP
jgi:hypothetical protein